ncbi:MAG: PAS domain S-box protein [Dehalococcoidia bacterium]|nr:MAG: PAS domain S-box protein [Dehalococcoidia bacterium]
MTPQTDPEQLARLVEQAPDAIIFADREGVIRVWNAAAERIFGYPAAAAIGRNLDIIIPEKLREAHWTGYDRALAAGDTKYRGQSLPTRALRQDGSEMYVELSFAIVRGRDGAVVGAMAQARDITERFERDRAMRRRLRELEGGAEGTNRGEQSS